MPEIVVKGEKELIKKLRELEKTITNKILRTEIRAATKEVAAAMKEAAPVAETSPDAGFLKKQIKVRGGKRKKGRIQFLAQITETDPEKWYATFVELGSKNQPAQHWAENVADEKLPGLAKDLPARIWERIQQEVRK